MKQNNSTELLAYSFPYVYHKNGTTMTKQCMNNLPVILFWFPYFPEVVFDGLFPGGTYAAHSWVPAQHDEDAASDVEELDEDLDEMSKDLMTAFQDTVTHLHDEHPQSLLALIVR